MSVLQPLVMTLLNVGILFLLEMENWWKVLDRYLPQVKVDFMFRMARNFYIGPMTTFDYVYGHDFEKPGSFKFWNRC